MELTTTLILIVVFTILEGFFSGAEIALISANRIKIEHQAEEGNSAAQALIPLLRSPEKLFAITSFGTNLAVVTNTAIFAAFMVSQFGERGDLYATLILSPIILFGGEIVPKIIFQNRADTMILLMVWPLIFFQKIFSPFISFFTGISNVLLSQFTGPDETNGQNLSREAIRQIISLEAKSSTLDIDEREMIKKIFDFSERNVEHCMTPLVQLYCLPDTASLEEAHQTANASGFSRLPVYHDRMFNLIGVLNTFDLINRPYDSSPITELIRQVYYVPPNKKIDDLLRELQQRGLHMAVVVDEYGGCIGIVTIEDLLEEIVGEIEDEYDKPEKRYETYTDGGYLVEADTEIEVLNQHLNLNLPRGEYETLGGLIIDQLEAIPSVGEQVNVNGYRLTVKETGKRKVNTVIVREYSATETDADLQEQVNTQSDPEPETPPSQTPVSPPASDKLTESPKT